MKQRGYIDINFTGLFLSLIFIGAVFGVFVSYFVPWLWSLVRPYIHAITG